MRKFFTKKRIIWTIIILFVLGVVGCNIFSGGNEAANILTDTARKQDIKQTVLATGQVVSGTDLTLSFKVSGVVKQVSVKEGQQVKSDEQLALLDQKDQIAALTQARGSLAQANANYRKVIDGASNEDIAVAQRAVDAAEVTLENARKSLTTTKQQQEVLVANAYQALMNAGLSAEPASGNISSTAPVVSGTYTGTEQGQYRLSLYSSGSGMRYSYQGLESGNGIVSDAMAVPLGTRGLYVTFSGNYSASDGWTVAVPNPKASTYITSYNAYQAALETKNVSLSSAEAAVRTAEVALTQSQASLDLKKAQARPADVQAAQAAILSAQGQVQSAEAALENTILRAPSDGVITKVDIRAGEQASALKEVVVLQDVGNLHVEANISEANIALVRPGQTVDLTFDALGSDRVFPAVVQTVNPASDVVSGVVNYKVTASLETLPEIKPGMTANMTILIGAKQGVLTVPQRAIILKDGKKFVRVVTDSKKKTYIETEVSTGMEADGGVVEISGGLEDGKEIVTFIKK